MEIKDSMVYTQTNFGRISKHACASDETTPRLTPTKEKKRKSQMGSSNASSTMKVMISSQNTPHISSKEARLDNSAERPSTQIMEKAKRESTHIS